MATISALEGIMIDLSVVIDTIDSLNDRAKTLQPDIKEVEYSVAFLIQRRNTISDRLKPLKLSDDKQIFYLNALSVVDDMLRKLKFYYANFN